MAQLSDCAELAGLRHALWPEGSVEEHARELGKILRGEAPGTMPLVEFVWESESGALLGFIEVALRSHADECDPSRPVGYVEGWYVLDTHRRQRIGAALLRAAEDWARGQGCKEMASDALLENEISQKAHEAVGFSVVGRNVLYRKNLSTPISYSKVHYPSPRDRSGVNWEELGNESKRGCVFDSARALARSGSYIIFVAAR